ncbi:MAG TPA: hypothetical protein VHW09_23395 [Bryobacteraceae bacterium]|nr:hypothetical protein [Bryobacteraceae bacterium]
MLRLFSMFPEGRPGVALLILRVSVAASIVEKTPDCISISALVCIAFGTLAVFLCLGFLTPLASWLTCAAEVACLVFGCHAEARFTVLSSLTAVALSLLGPGAFSVDARLFGRREIVFAPRSR